MRDHESYLPIGEISFRDRLRQLNRDTVETLKASITRIGLRVPISVRFISDDEGYTVVAGLHRFVACQELGFTEVPVREEDGTPDDARMWEIAENLHRAELTALERDEHFAEWVRLCDREKGGQIIHPGGEQPHDKGISAASREFNVARHEVRAAIKVAENLAPEAKEEAKALGLDDNQSALLKAAAKATPEAQKQSLQEHKARKERKPRKAKPVQAPAVERGTVDLAEARRRCRTVNNALAAIRAIDDDLVPKFLEDLFTEESDDSWRGLKEKVDDLDSSLIVEFLIVRMKKIHDEHWSEFWDACIAENERRATGGLDELQPANPEPGDQPPPESQTPAAAPANNDIVENDQAAESALESDPLTALQKQYRNLSDRPGAYGWIMRRLCQNEVPAKDDASEVAEFIRRFMAAPGAIRNKFRAGLIGEQPVGAGGR